jgi:hypothetical protein
VKYSDFDNTTGSHYNLPTVADARSLEKGMTDSNSKQHALNYRFYNTTVNSNGGYYAKLKEVYLPSGATYLFGTFENCSKLTTIHGDLSTILSTQNGFSCCASLTEMPYMPNLENLNNGSFRNCTGLTSITFYKVLKNWHTGALTGCTNIETINLVDGWNTAIYVQHCPKLTQACLHDMCEKLADMTGQTAPVMNVGSTNMAKIDDEHKAIVTNKNWTLA